MTEFELYKDGLAAGIGAIGLSLNNLKALAAAGVVSTSDIENSFEILMASLDGIGSPTLSATVEQHVAELFDEVRAAAKR